MIIRVLLIPAFAHGAILVEPYQPKGYAAQVLRGVRMHSPAQAVPLASHSPGNDVSVLSKTSTGGSGGFGGFCVELVYKLVTDAVD